MIVLASVVDTMNELAPTLKDLGVPTIVGAVLGALIAHYTAKARGRQDREWAIDHSLVLDERRAAQAAYVAIRDVRLRLNSLSEHLFAQPGSTALFGLYGQVRNSIEAQVRLIRNDELNSRVRTMLDVIFLATLTDTHTEYTIARAAQDVEEALEAWVRAEEIPLAHVPASEELRDLVRVDGRITFEGPLKDLLADRQSRYPVRP